MTADRIRIISSPAFIQMSPLYRSLLHQSFDVIDRRSLGGSSLFRITHPHLIIDGKTGIIFVQLSKVLGNVVRPEDHQSEGSEAGELKRQETLFATLRCLTRSYDRIVLILQERESTTSSVVPYDYTPPVLQSLQQLDDEIEKARLGVEVVFSKGVQESGRLVRALVEELRELEGHRGGRVKIWDNRKWIPDDPTEVIYPLFSHRWILLKLSL